MVEDEHLTVLLQSERAKLAADRYFGMIENDDSVRKFDQILRADQVAPGTRRVYFQQMVRIRRLLPQDAPDLGELSEDQLLTVLGEIADKSKGSGYLTTARTMKRFYRSIGREDMAKRIRVPSKKAKIPEILTEDELKTLLNAAGMNDGNLRNHLIVELLWESMCRVGELCNLKIKDVQFDEYSAILHLDGKTGQRRVRVFSSRPDLLEYINRHPFKNDPQAALFVSNYGIGARNQWHQLTEYGVRQMLADLSRRVLNRRIHPHQLRHTRATEMSRHLTDRELKILGGWKRTNMLEVYSHLSGKDVDDKLLALHGFKPQEANGSTIAVRICPQSDCRAENSPMAIYCQKCGHSLASDSTEDLLKDPKFIAGLAENREFIDALKKALNQS